MLRSVFEELLTEFNSEMMVHKGRQASQEQALRDEVIAEHKTVIQLEQQAAAERERRLRDEESFRANLDDMATQLKLHLSLIHI